MPNSDWNQQVGNLPTGRAKEPPPTGEKGSSPAAKEGGASWGGLPGKAQPGGRGKGVPEATIYPKKEGL